MLQVASFLHLLSDDLRALILSRWLDVRSIVTLDVAVSSKTCRPYWIAFLHSVRRCRCIDDMSHTAASLMWLSIRGICISRMEMKVDAWQVPGCDLSLLRTVDLLHVVLNGCSGVTDQCILTIARVCRRLNSIDIRCRGNATDACMSALSRGCGLLQNINISNCDKVTDAGISALGHGCGQLQSINIGNCDKVTDAGISALGHGCVMESGYAIRRLK